jgi:hypothetical protein
MARERFSVGERVEVYCYHRRGQALVRDWLAGVVVEADDRMAAVHFDVPVFANTGWPVPDGILWSAHGSPRVRRPPKAPTAAGQ